MCANCRRGHGTDYYRYIENWDSFLLMFYTQSYLMMDFSDADTVVTVQYIKIKTKSLSSAIWLDRLN